MKKRISRIIDFYTRDFEVKEIRTLFKKEVPDVLNFYRKGKSDEKLTSNPRVLLRFLKLFFISFLEKLTPLRRIIFSVSFFSFIYAAINDKWDVALFAFFIVSVLLVFEVADKIIIKDELSVAREIQKSILPKSKIEIDGYDIAYYSESSAEIGGDFLTFLNKRNTIIVGDISGKGIAAALFMLQCHALIKFIDELNFSQRELIITLNKKLYEIFQRRSFLTLGAAAVHNNSIKYYRAGHLPLFVYSSKEKKVHKFSPKGIGLGLTNNHVFDDSLEEVEIKINENDFAILFTDGLSETMNKQKELYGEELIVKLMEHHSDKSAEQFKEILLRSVKYFRANEPMHDDLSFVIFKKLS